MKRRKIALASVTSLLAVPTVGLTIGVVAGCNKDNTPPDDSGISVSTKDVEVNHNSGIGEFDIIMDEQPVDNQIYVYVITAEGPHHMELLGPDDRVYHGHPAILYDMYNGIAHVKMGFTEFIGETTKTVVSLEVRYNNRKGEWVLKHIYGINLTVTYVQHPLEEVHIFALNDLHGVAEGYGESKIDYPTTNVKNPGVIRLMNEIGHDLDVYPGSFLVTAGDNNSGDMFSTALHGESIYKVLNKMGARYSAVGNHAFEWGLAPMATYQFDKWARTDETMGSYFLASNILNGKISEEKQWVTDPDNPDFMTDYAYWQSQRVAWADPYKLVNMNGHLVCLVGLTTQSTPEDGNKSVVDNLSFIDYNAALDYSMYTCKQELKPQVFNSIESVVLLTHVESAQDETTGEASGDAVEIAETATEPKLDAIISAHSHKTVDAKIYNGSISKNVLVGQAETEGRKYLDISLQFDNTKPVGQKKVRVEQEVVDMKMAEKYPSDTPENWQKASDELNAIKASPRSERVIPVKSEFENQTANLRVALNTKIATRDDSLLYPAVNWTDGGIGHGYYINERGYTVEDPKRPYTEKGYIIDQLGAWINYAELLGFSSIYNDDIESSSKGLTYPAISLINQDSMKIEYPEPESARDRDVTLKHMYSIQTYENTTKFGYISVWQLANVINHSLAGEGIFDYNEPKENYYVPQGPSKTPDNSLNNLSRYYYGTGESDWYTTCDPTDFENHGTYKGLDNTYCLYNCGPIQSYGFRFRVKPAVPGNPGALDENTHRRWVLDNEPATKVGTPFSSYPAIWIMDPVAEEGAKPYTTITTPSLWLSAEDYVTKYGGMIPMITNDFLFNGANWETPMVKVYMEQNEDEDWRSYPVMSFSTITRDLMIEFAKMTSFQLDFDMPISIVEKLVTYKES
ncbi:MAG: hypothetical protein ACOQNV_02690 [Mycoplasmoidaceae bacterium]